MLKRSHLLEYVYLMRLHKPIGILLLLWPTLWALWLASGGLPDNKILFIFIAGVILMRSVGCIVNDFADRRFDLFVKRTCDRPLATKKIAIKEALCLAGLLTACAFALVLFCNALTIKLAFVGAFLTCTYPYLKRITHLPQVGLGFAFSWGIPMAFAALLNNVPAKAWVLFLVSVLWPVIYDTQYAMIDRDDDLNIGVKSTAVLFAHHTVWIISGLQIAFLILLILVGEIFKLSAIYFFSVMAVGFLFLYQTLLLQKETRTDYFRAFLNNNWVGLCIFIGIFLSYPI